MDQVPDLSENPQGDEQQKENTEGSFVKLVADPQEKATCQFSKFLEFNIIFF